MKCYFIEFANYFYNLWTTIWKEKIDKRVVEYCRFAQSTLYSYNMSEIFLRR